MDIFDTVFSHLIVDHISRAIDKKEAAKADAAAAAAAKPAATSGDVGSHRARLRREALRRLAEES
jgi:hypothetical protein